MKLSKEEQALLNKMIKNPRNPGMIIWMEPHADGDTYPNGYVQGDPFDMAMMAMHAIDFAANAFGISPEQMATMLARMFSDRGYKPSNITGELRKLN